MYCLQGKYDQAIADFDKAIELNPQYAQAYSGRAKANYNKQEYVKAWEDVHKAEELGDSLNPDFITMLKQASARDQ